MTPYHESGDIRIYHGDARDVLADLDTQATACVTDPPYGLAFMGRSWDDFQPREYQDWCMEWGEIVMDALLPGAPVLAFSGTRTAHRLTCGLEGAGLVIRDRLAWMYGSGFPKSLDIGKQVDKERYTAAETRKVTAWVEEKRNEAGLSNDHIDRAFDFNGMAGHWTTQGEQAAVPTLEKVPLLLNVLDLHHGQIPDDIYELLIERNTAKGEPAEEWHDREKVGERQKAESFKYDGNRVYQTDGDEKNTTLDITAPATDEAERWDGYGTALAPAHEPVILAMKPKDGTFAENAMEHGTAGLNIDAARVETNGNYTSGGAQAWAGDRGGLDKDRTEEHPQGRWPANVVLDEAAAELVDRQSGVIESGARTPNGSRQRSSGFEMTGGSSEKDSGGASRFFYTAKASKQDRNAGLPPGEENDHPTVKPTDLIGWLLRLVEMPERNLILDPFLGSGTTTFVCQQLGLPAIGIEQDEESCELAAKRLSEPSLFS